MGVPQIGHTVSVIPLTTCRIHHTRGSHHRRRVTTQSCSDGTTRNAEWSLAHPVRAVVGVRQLLEAVDGDYLPFTPRASGVLFATLSRWLSVSRVGPSSIGGHRAGWFRVNQPVRVDIGSVLGPTPGENVVNLDASRRMANPECEFDPSDVLAFDLSVHVVGAGASFFSQVDRVDGVLPVVRTVNVE